jgi:Ca-activated chloride channel homolog
MGQAIALGAKGPRKCAKQQTGSPLRSPGRFLGFLFLVAALILSIWLPSAGAQTPTPNTGSKEPVQQGKPQAPYRLGIEVDLVNLEVSVTDEKGNFVSDLKRENFRVLDEGVEQPLTNFASVEAPAQVLLLVETSPAVYLIHQEHLAAAHALLEGLALDDRVALGTYDRSARLLLDFTLDKLALAQALDSLHYNLGMADLNLFDGLAAALDWLAPVSGKKAVVLLTTGLDTSGPARWDELLGRMRASDVVVLPVALGGELRQYRGKSGKKKTEAAGSAGEEADLSFAKADRVLEAIGEATGGRAYFPRDAREFAGIYRQIADLLRHEYSLGFRPPARDARFHKIQVQVVDAGGHALAASSGPGRAGLHPYRISCRQGYLAPGP